jgi:hypothetical protein
MWFLTISLGLSTIFISPAFAKPGNYGNWHMGRWMMGNWGMGWFGGIFMLLFLGINRCRNHFSDSMAVSKYW